MAPHQKDGKVTSEVEMMNLDGSDRVQITSDGTFKFLPHFSPDATKIVYAKFATGGYGSPDATFDVAVYDIATQTETLITSGGDNNQGTWSPDGKRIAFMGSAGMNGGAVVGGSMWVVDADGSNPTKIGTAAGTDDDAVWGDIAWSSDDWILFVVAENVDGCGRVRTDKIRPDGTSRTKVSDGGPNCTPMGHEQSGDADPGWSADGKTIYSSRGFPVAPDGGGTGSTERKLYAFSSDAWSAGKPELDLSLPAEPSCIEGVPKGSPDGTRILLFRNCFDTGTPIAGIFVTDTAGSYRTFVVDGFGPDWNPRAGVETTRLQL